MGSGGFVSGGAGKCDDASCEPVRVKAAFDEPEVLFQVAMQPRNDPRNAANRSYGQMVSKFGMDYSTDPACRSSDDVEWQAVTDLQGNREFAGPTEAGCRGSDETGPTNCFMDSTVTHNIKSVRAHCTRIHSLDAPSKSAGMRFNLKGLCSPKRANQLTIETEIEEVVSGMLL